MSEWIGHTLSKVEIQKLLGRGGMADVYLGRHTTLNRPVAVKILHSHLSENDSLLARFRAEAQAVAAMRHPHIVQVLDFDIADDRPYIVMELLDGISLRDYLSEARKLGRKLEPETVAFLISSLASALDYAHARGIVHRDVKPANVMLRRDGPIDPAVPLPHDVDVVLTDFGVAHMADASIQTASGVIIGTPSYMSPEQVKGELIDGRSDIYALGIILYEMLSGQLPFDGDTQASILIKHISEPIPPLPGAIPDVQAVINRALAKDPAKRYQKASDLASSLEAALRLPNSRGVTDAATFLPPSNDDTYATRQLNVTPEITSAAHPPQPFDTVANQQVGKSFPMMWIAVGIAAVAILIVAFLLLKSPSQIASTSRSTPTSGQAVAATESTDEPTGEATSQVAITEQATQSPIVEGGDGPIGQLLFRDDTAILNLKGIEPPPQGSAYEAWLTEPNVEPLSMRVVEIIGDTVSLTYSDPQKQNLAASYSGFALSVEPSSDNDPAISGQIAYRGQMPQDLVDRLRLMFSTARGLTLRDAVLQGITGQANTYDVHVDNTIDAVHAGNLPMAKTHAEHVINIVVGKTSLEYADYNGNGRQENPGDGVGLETYLLILQQSASSAARSSGNAGDQQTADSISEQVNTILPIIDAAKNDELRVTAADSLNELTDLILDLDQLHVEAQTQPLVESVGNLNLAIGIDVIPNQN